MEGSDDINDDLQVDFGSKDLKCKSVITESASVNVGPGVTLSDRGGFVQSRSNVTGRDFIALDYQIDTGGTQKPIYYKRDARVIRDVVQPDDSQTMTGITSYAVTPTKDQDISRVYVKLVNPVTNYRARVTSDVTGEVVKYIPSRNDWDNGTGINYAAGEQFFDLDSPLAEDLGFPLTVDVLADQSIDVLGDGVLPWRAVDSYDITNETVLTYTDPLFERLFSEHSTQVTSGLDINPDGAIGVATTFTVSGGALESVDPAFTTDTTSSETIEFATNANIAPLFNLPNLNWIVATSVGTVVVRSSPPTSEQRRSEALLGVVSFDGAVITESVSIKQNYRQIGNQLIDFMNAVGNLKVNDDGTIEPATVGGLTLAHTDVELFGNNINFVSDSNPHYREYSGQDPITNMVRYLGDGTLQATGLSDIDPSNYNPSGGGTYTSMPGGANRAQIIQIWIRVDTGTPIYLPGQIDYTNISDAISEFVNYRPVLPEVISVGSVKLGSIIVRSGATDLTDEADAVFVATTKFGDVNPLAAPVSDIEPTPVDNNMVMYDLSLNKLVDSGMAGTAFNIQNNFSIPAGVWKARYVVENVASDITITLPVAPNANMEYEFINSRRAFGGWEVSGFNVIVTWNDGVDDYFVTLTPDPLKGDYDYESYTFRFDFNEWRFTYNG
jgi:hypothetical protein